MKSFLFILSLFTLTLTASATDSEPKLTLNVYYVEPGDTLFLQSIRRSNETCCKYEFKTIRSSQYKIEVYNKEENLGTIFGYPTDKFLLDIYDRFYKSK